ncbi:MAG: ATP synthase F1 subunit delta [Clostridiales Family XIII bacterium]|jgi:ATP synthase F1 delta subunit|nr:ATP synthase F1 subunit delta [Clostridiales Family XIII bacterium]
MENLSVNEVYGSALLDASTQLGRTDEFRETLESLRAVFREIPEFFLLLKTPALSAEQRREVARRALAEKLPPELLNFLFILIDKRRIGQFDGIVNAFARLADRRHGITKGRILSAVPLTEDQHRKFEEETGKLLRMKVALMPEISAELVGGVRIYVEGKLIDASIRRKLDDMKEQLLR